MSAIYPKHLVWHDAPELPPWEGEEIAVLTYCKRACTFDVAQFNWKPDDSFLMGVDRWAMLWPTSGERYMRIKPLPDRVGQCIAAFVLLVMSPVIIPAIAGVFALHWITKVKQRAIGPRPEWQSWFAWYPVHLDAPWGHWVWLENVDRRCFRPLSEIQYTQTH